MPAQVMAWLKSIQTQYEEINTFIVDLQMIELFYQVAENQFLPIEAQPPIQIL